MEKFKKCLSFAYKSSPIVFLIVGILCIIFNDVIYSVFPFVFAGLMIAVGVIGVIFDFLHVIKKRLFRWFFPFRFYL